MIGREFQGKVKKVSIHSSSLRILIPSNIVKELNLSEGDDIRVTIRRLFPLEYFCVACEYYFSAEEDREDVVCPICDESRPVRLVRDIHRDERRLKMKKSKQVEDEKVEDEKVDDEKVDDESDTDEVEDDTDTDETVGDESDTDEDFDED